jgi:hypothetical protein
MQIERVVIERKDGDTFCGILTYEHALRHQMLTWSFHLDTERKVVLLLYPASSATAYPEVQLHYRELADAILDAILNRASP